MHPHFIFDGNHSEIKKKVLLFLLVFTLSVHGSLQYPLQAKANVFTDVKEGYTYYTALRFLKERNIIQGYQDGSFQPDKDINRAEALVLLLRTFSKEPNDSNRESANAASSEQEKTFHFSDVKEGDWFYDTVKKAFENGIIQGDKDLLFHPNRAINRAEALKIALLQENLPLPTQIQEQPYTDVPVDVWFAPYAEVSKIRQIILKTRTNGGKLMPDVTMSRAEFAELIYRMLQSRNNWHFGRATYYADSLAGRRTSSGEPYSPNLFTAAHRTLPFGTKILVKNMANGKETIVTVNDRGPYATGVDLDLSKSAFSSIANISNGIIRTEYTILYE